MLLTGSEIVIEILAEEGVDTVFGYPGGNVLSLYDKLAENKKGINAHPTAHEQGASHAADGYSRVGNKVGVLLATSGSRSYKYHNWLGYSLCRFGSCYSYNQEASP